VDKRAKKLKITHASQTRPTEQFICIRQMATPARINNDRIAQLLHRGKITNPQHIDQAYCTSFTYLSNGVKRL